MKSDVKNLRISVLGDSSTNYSLSLPFFFRLEEKIFTHDKDSWSFQYKGLFRDAIVWIAIHFGRQHLPSHLTGSDWELPPVR